MLGVGRPVVSLPNVSCPCCLVMSVISIERINIRKEMGISKEGEEVGLKWTKKRVKIVSNDRVGPTPTPQGILAEVPMEPPPKTSCLCLYQWTCLMIMVTKVHFFYINYTMVKR